MDHGKIKLQHPENAVANQIAQVLAWIATCVQVAFLEGTVIQGLIVLNDATYIPERWHGTLRPGRLLPCRSFAMFSPGISYRRWRSLEAPATLSS
jgi:hypothetical protein